MKNSIALISRVTLIGLMLIGVVLWLMVIYGGDDSVGPILTWGYIIFFIAIALALVSTVNGVLVNPAGLKNMLIGLGIVVAVFGLSYVLADGSDFATYKVPTDESTSKLVSTGLNAFYIVGLLAVLSVVYSGVARFFK